MKNKNLILLILAIYLILLSFQFVSAEDATYCCEKTKTGAFCQNAPQSQCDAGYKSSPTSCDSTSYCKAGCCFDSKEGLCMENTPQRVCEAAGASWANDSTCAIPQCNLGCCVLGDQGAFVTLARCKAVSGFYGLKTDFRTNIADEVSCVAVAQSQDKGACVFEDASVNQNTCIFTTRASCKTAGVNSLLPNSTTSNNTAGPGFYKDTLCTAASLGTNCAKSTKTMLIAGRDEIYFMDTCNQPANIYDASRYNDNIYWTKVFTKLESCNSNSNNAKNPSCGNCDYYLGSIGKKASGIGNPTYGDYICADLSCKSVGKRHGESWCVTDNPSGDGLDPVGSRYFKQVCINGEVLTEPCADYRNEICIEDTFNSYSEAACRVNRWQDCTQQKEEADCINLDQRDCKWIANFYFSSNSGQIEKSNNDTDKGPLTPTGLCVPNYPPGSAFWGTTSTGRTTSKNLSFGTGYIAPTSAGTSTKDQCSIGNAKVTFKWVKSIKPLAFWEKEPWEKEPAWECDSETGNCQLTDADIKSANLSQKAIDQWSADMNGICYQIGDCGGYINWQGKETGNCQYLTDADIKSANLSQKAIDQWSADMNGICYQIGDCGGYINWQGKYTEEGYATYKDTKRVAGSGGAEILEASKTSVKSTTSNLGRSSTSGASISQAASAISSLSSISGKVTGNVVSDMLKEIFVGN